MDQSLDLVKAIVGVEVVDVGGDHLAPEADRISQAISYTKGCYLGQEPIARLDALGHVNNTAYLRWFETVRVGWFLEYGL